MFEQRCPGQDTRYWKLTDIFESMCVHCGRPIEFFKTDLKRSCPHCGLDTLNPRNDLSCAGWCKSAKECLASVGLTPEDGAAGPPQATDPKV